MSEPILMLELRLYSNGQVRNIQTVTLDTRDLTEGRLLYAASLQLVRQEAERWGSRPQ